MTRERALAGAAGRRLRAPAASPWIRLRIVVAGVLLLLLLAAVTYRAYGIQVRDGERHKQRAEGQHATRIEVPAPRGVIYDRQGVELAVTADIDSIYADPSRVDDPDGTAAALSEVLAIDVDTVSERLGRDNRFAWISRHVTAQEASEVRALGLPGVALTSEPRRFYPARATTGPVLGFSNIDGEGLDGIELAMDDVLTGVRGELGALRDARGRLAISEPLAAAEPGAALTLTLDRFVQSTTHRALARAVEDHEASAGTAIVLDVETGGVLAMASYPSYDPNEPAAGLAEGARNRAITDAHEPGSILKVFLVAAALDAGAARPDTTFDLDGGRMRIGRNTVRDTYEDDELDVSGIIRRSSNVGSVKLARLLGAEGYEQALRRYGFAARTGIELPGERAGRLRPHGSWRDIEFATLAFGYGMMATPLQLTAALAAVGNEGIYNPPRIVERAVSESGDTLFEREPKGERVMDAEVANAVLPMLASVFYGGPDGGTAQRVHVDGYQAGGKTGTAVKVDHEAGGYHDDKYVASFAGLAPIDDPQLAVLVLIDEPGGDVYYGGHVAGPAFADIVSQTLRYRGVPPAEDADLQQRGAGSPQRPRAPRIPDPRPPIVVENPREQGAGAEGGRKGAGDGGWQMRRMPDLRGMGMARALERAEATCADVEVSGSGAAERQQPAAGTPIPAPTRCRIEFARRGWD